MPTLERTEIHRPRGHHRPADWLIEAAKTILDNPEPGFTEVKTSRFVSEKMSQLGIAHPVGNGAYRTKGCGTWRQARSDGRRYR